jgi:isopenicillin-N epimerase
VEISGDAMADDPDPDEQAAPPRSGFSRRALMRGALAAGGLAGLRRRSPEEARAAPANLDERWARFRALFELDPQAIHLAGMLLAPHPRPVREAIERHRAALDRDPATHVQNMRREARRARTAAADYLGARPHEIALTFNTTTGLGLIYGGVRIREGQRFLTTEHDYHATHQAIRYRAARTGAEVDVIRMYDRPQDARDGEMVDRVLAAVTPATRVVALTWVHSSSGVKIPVRAIADALAERNRDRAPADRALLCIDGVHGLGVEDVDAGALGCDALIAGTHKWLFGPRGTGIVWAREGVHAELEPIIETFTPGDGWGGQLSPGGFHAFEHRWALAEAFALHRELGRGDVARRIRDLNERFKDGLAELDRVTLVTPRDPALSAGIICFEVRGATPGQVVRALRERQIIASVSPYQPAYARLAPGLLNSPDEVEPVIAALGAMP